jgi:hypothetical protein
VHAKSDAEIIAVRPVMDLPNVTLLTGAEVLSLETGSGGRVVTGVVVSRGGQREVYQGDVVALSAGLANGSGQVGRNYMFHNSKAMVALGKERNDTGAWRMWRRTRWTCG